MAQRPSARVVEAGCIAHRPCPWKADVVYLACGDWVGHGAKSLWLSIPIGRHVLCRFEKPRCEPVPPGVRLLLRSAFDALRFRVRARLSPAPRMTLTRTASEAVIVAERTGLFWPIRPRACWPARGLFSLKLMAGSGPLPGLAWGNGMISPGHLAILTLPYSRPANRKPIAGD